GWSARTNARAAPGRCRGPRIRPAARPRDRPRCARRDRLVRRARRPGRFRGRARVAPQPTAHHHRRRAHAGALDPRGGARMSKFDRQGAILRLEQDRSLATQEELAEALREVGHDAVQTTISRDIAQLGLVKVRDPAGRLVYALPGSADLDRLDELTTALRRFALSLTPTGNLLVIHTPPGH